MVNLWSKESGVVAGATLIASTKIDQLDQRRCTLQIQNSLGLRLIQSKRLKVNFQCWKKECSKQKLNKLKMQQKQLKSPPFFCIFIFFILFRSNSSTLGLFTTIKYSLTFHPILIWEAIQLNSPTKGIKGSHIWELFYREGGIRKKYRVDLLNTLFLML